MGFMKAAHGIIGIAAVAVLLTGCVPGQPQRAVETATGLAKAYVGSAGTPGDYTCPGVTLQPRPDPAPEAEIDAGSPVNQANGTIVVPMQIVIGGEKTSYDVTLRQDGACVLAVR